METARNWIACEIGFVETARAVELVTGEPSLEFEHDWREFDVVPVTHELSLSAARIAVDRRLRTLDALHLAAATSLAVPTVTVATWDTQMRRACAELSLDVFPETLPA